MSFQPRAGISEGVVARRPRLSVLMVRLASRGEGAESPLRSLLLGNRYSDASAAPSNARSDAKAQPVDGGWGVSDCPRLLIIATSAVLSCPTYTLQFFKNVPAAAYWRSGESISDTRIFAAENKRDVVAPYRVTRPVAQI